MKYQVNLEAKLKAKIEIDGVNDAEEAIREAATRMKQIAGGRTSDYRGYLSEVVVTKAEEVV